MDYTHATVIIADADKASAQADLGEGIAARLTVQAPAN